MATILGDSISMVGGGVTLAMFFIVGRGFYSVVVGGVTLAVVFTKVHILTGTLLRGVRGLMSRYADTKKG